MHMVWKEEWCCPSQIQNWLQCFPGPLRASGCTEGLLLLPNARGWTIGSWGHRPITDNHLRFLSSRKCMRRWLGLGGHLFLPEKAYCFLRPHHPRRRSGPRVCGHPPSRARYCHAALPVILLSRACKFLSAIFCPGSLLLSPPCRRLQPLCLLVVKGALLRPPAVWSTRASGVPEMGDPESLEPALQEMVTALFLPPEEVRVENLLFPFCFFQPLAPQPVVPKTSKKEQFPFSLGHKRARMAVHDAQPRHPCPPLL